MMTWGTGSMRPPTWVGCADAEPDSARRKIQKRDSAHRITSAPFELPDASRQRTEHVICGLDHLGIHLVGALRRDQLGDFLHRIDVRVLEVALMQRAKACLPWCTGDG